MLHIFRRIRAGASRRTGLHHRWIRRGSGHQYCALPNPVKWMPIAAAVLAGTFAAEFDVAIADGGEAGRQERRQAQGWLQLKQDQKVFREGVEPLTPRQAERLDRLDLRQQGRARELEQRQRRSLNSERNFRRGTEVERPTSRSRGLKEQRQLDRQRLETQILRQTLSPGRY